MDIRGLGRIRCACLLSPKTASESDKATFQKQQAIFARLTNASDDERKPFLQSRTGRFLLRTHASTTAVDNSIAGGNNRADTDAVDDVSLIRECRAACQFNALPRPGTLAFFGVEEQDAGDDGGDDGGDDSRRRQRNDDADDADDDADGRNIPTPANSARRRVFGLDKPVVDDSSSAFVSSMSVAAHIMANRTKRLRRELSENGSVQLDSGAAYGLCHVTVELLLSVLRRMQCYAQCERNIDLQRRLQDGAPPPPPPPPPPKADRIGAADSKSLRFVRRALDALPPHSAVAEAATQSLDFSQKRTIPSTSASVTNSRNGQLELFGLLEATPAVCRAALQSLQ